MSLIHTDQEIKSVCDSMTDSYGTYTIWSIPSFDMDMHTCTRMKMTITVLLNEVLAAFSDGFKTLNGTGSLFFEMLN